MKYTVFMLLIFALCGCYGKKPKLKTGLEGKPMPEINVVNVDNNIRFNTINIPIGKPSIIFSFEPWCPYCKAQTETLISQIASLKDVNIYMFAASKKSMVKDFYEHYKLYKYPNIKVGIDSSKSFRTYYNDGRIPYLAVYDRNKKLKEVFVGKTMITSLREAAF